MDIFFLYIESDIFCSSEDVFVTAETVCIFEDDGDMFFC